MVHGELMLVPSGEPKPFINSTRDAMFFHANEQIGNPWVGKAELYHQCSRSHFPTQLLLLGVRDVTTIERPGCAFP